MEDKKRQFRTEIAGSLVPMLEGAPSSFRHPAQARIHIKEITSRAAKKPTEVQKYNSVPNTGNSYE